MSQNTSEDNQQDNPRVVKVVKNTSRDEFISHRLEGRDRERGFTGRFERPDEVTDSIVDSIKEKKDSEQKIPSFMRRPGGHTENNQRRNSVNINEINRNPSPLEKENPYISTDNQNNPRVVKVVKKDVDLESFPGDGLSRVKWSDLGPSEEVLRLIRARLKGRHSDISMERGLVPGGGSREGRNPGLLVSRDTMEQYLRRGRTLFERWKLVTGAAPEHEEDADPIAFVNWLLSLKQSLKSSTWRMYRQSVMHFLDGFPGYNTGEALRLLETDIVEASSKVEIERRRKLARKGRGGINAITDVAGEDGGESGDEGDDDEDRTSSLKEKKIPEDALEKIRLRLKLGSRSKLNETLTDWLESGILTGLRPVEWQAVDIVTRNIPVSSDYPYGRMVLLYVINAKATNGRGTGIARTLDLSGFGDREIGVVSRHVSRCREWLDAGIFMARKGQTATLLRTTVRALWPNSTKTGINEGRHYALYSCRHQAIANWKSLGMPLAEIAALVGHLSTATTTERYGKKRSGWKPERIPAPPRGVPEEVTMVKQRINLFHERLKHEKDLGLRSEGPSEFMI